MTEKELIDKIIECCKLVYEELGPGLYESAYEKALMHELTIKGISCENQIAIPYIYKGTPVDKAYRADILVSHKDVLFYENIILPKDYEGDRYKEYEYRIVIELKSTESISDLYIKQLKTYLKLTNINCGLLVNFNVDDIEKGIVIIKN